MTVTLFSILYTVILELSVLVVVCIHTVVVKVLD